MRPAGLAVGVALLLSADASAQKIGVVQSHVKVSETFGSFAGGLPEGALFGSALAAIGDLDGDGVDDLAAGAPGDDAAYVLFMTAEGAVADARRIDGDDVPAAGVGKEFGAALAWLGDVDDDGVPELAVGEPLTTTGGTIHVLSIDVDGSVLASRYVTSIDGFPTTLDSGDEFASALGVIGDLNGDGRAELAVGAPGDDDGLGDNTGAVWVLFLDEDGLVADARKISDTQGNFGAQLQAADRFGTSVAGLGDVDGDGLPDLAVGAIQDDDPVTDDDEDELGISVDVDSGAVWILFLDETGAVVDHQKISNRRGGFSGCSIDDVLDEVFGLFDEEELLTAVDIACTLDVGDRFGSALAGPGDIDGDGVPDVIVGARTDDDGNGANSGAVWVLQLAPDGKVRTKRKISDDKGKFSGQLDPSDRFGFALAAFVGDGAPTGGLGSLPLAVGAPGDDDGGALADDEDEDRGAAWLLRVKVFAGVESFDGEIAVGDRVLGGITAGGRHRFDVPLVAGSTLTVVAKRRRNPVEPQVSLQDGDVVLAGGGDSVVSPKLARIAKFAVEDDLTATIVLDNLSPDAGGDYRLLTKAKLPLAIASSVAVPAGEAVEAASFAALPGWTLRKLVVTPSSKACEGVDAGDLVPQLVSLTGFDDVPLDLEGHVTTKKSGAIVIRDVVLPVHGPYTLTIAGAEATAGCAKVVGRLGTPKAATLLVPDP